MWNTLEPKKKRPFDICQSPPRGIQVAAPRTGESQQHPVSGAAGQASAQVC